MAGTEPMSSQKHWTGVYSEKPPDAVSWYQDEPALSLALIRRAAAPPARVIDVGGGASFLADRLLERGFRVGVLDVAAEPLEIVRRRLGPQAEDVEWFVADVTRFAPPHRWDVWHDRAVFHFLTDAADRLAYREVLLNATEPGAAVIVATFAAAGPERCSGLPVVRYEPEQLQAELGDGLQLMEVAYEEHRTPSGAPQQFVYCRFRRLAAVAPGSPGQ